MSMFNRLRPVEDLVQLKTHVEEKSGKAVGTLVMETIPAKTLNGASELRPVRGTFEVTDSETGSIRFVSKSDKEARHPVNISPDYVLQGFVHVKSRHKV